MKIYGENKSLYIWACLSRNSDQIMIVLGDDSSIDINNMFDEKAYNGAKYFPCDDYNNATDYVYNQIKFMFKKNFFKDTHYKFDCNYTLEEIKRIKEDAKELSYYDYRELASFYDENEQYSCDLIVSNGKFGIQFNKYFNRYNYENLTFEECDINLDDELSLMLDMKGKLDNFIEEELEYSIEMDNTVKI